MPHFDLVIGADCKSQGGMILDIGDEEGFDRHFSRRGRSTQR
jgi:hypothetical protein